MLFEQHKDRRSFQQRRIQEAMQEDGRRNSGEGGVKKRFTKASFQPITRCKKALKKIGGKLARVHGRVLCGNLRRTNFLENILIPILIHVPLIRI